MYTDLQILTENKQINSTQITVQGSERASEKLHAWVYSGHVAIILFVTVAFSFAT